MSNWGNFDPQKNAVTMRISRELAIDMGLVEPSPEEQAERARSAEEFSKRCDAANLRKGEWLAALAAVTDPALRAVIDLHQLDREYGAHCQGCDQGCSCDLAEWPCSTIVAVLDALGSDTTDIDLANWRSEL